MASTLPPTMPHQRPSGHNVHQISGWRCPLCLGGYYEAVVVTRPNGGTYRTEFFQCGRCSVVFRDPSLYARLGIPVKRWQGDIGPKTLAEAHLYWRDALEKKD